jgi:hypothetical protein
MSNTMIIEVEMMLRLASPEPVVVPARFRYEPADPYAVSATFHTEPASVTWTFARDLLATGLDQPAGIGDVRIWPSPWVTPHGDQVVVVLSSPDGYALLEAPRKALFRFLRRTYALVPPGQETSHQDIDTALSRLLNR